MNFFKNFFIKKRKVSNIAIKKRVFKKNILDEHIKYRLIGKTPQFISSNHNILDIGASVGLYASYWSKYCRKVYCFEPSSLVYQQLKETISKFNNLEAKKIAISSYKGVSNFYLDPDRLSENTLSTNSLWPKEEVMVNTVDNLGIDDICFIKIDTEGNELNVLKGAIETIKKYKPTVMCEIYKKNLNKIEIKEIFDFFDYRKYKFFCKFYSQKQLYEIKSVMEGVEIALDKEKMIDVDADFLFVYNGS